MWYDGVTCTAKENDYAACIHPRGADRSTPTASGGEVKVNPHGFVPEFLTEFDTIYIDNQPVKVRSAQGP